MNVIQLVVGGLLLLAGQRLYWFFVGAIGFVIGLTLATNFLETETLWFQLLIAVIAGIIGAVLAAMLQRLAVAAAGFVAGGYGVALLLNALGLQPGGIDWLPFLVGGVVGALLVGLLYDWALVFLSSLLGAGLVVQAMGMETWAAAMIFVALFVVGVGIQGIGLRKTRQG